MDWVAPERPPFREAGPSWVERVMVHSGYAESGGVGQADGKSQVGRAQGGETPIKRRACGVNSGEGLRAPDSLPSVLLEARAASGVQRGPQPDIRLWHPGVTCTSLSSQRHFLSVPASPRAPFQAHPRPLTAGQGPR